MNAEIRVTKHIWEVVELYDRFDILWWRVREEMWKNRPIRDLSGKAVVVAEPSHHFLHDEVYVFASVRKES